MAWWQSLIAALLPSLANWGAEEIKKPLPEKVVPLPKRAPRKSVGKRVEPQD